MDVLDSYTWFALDLAAGFHDSQPDPDGFRRSLDRLSEFVHGAVDAYDLDADPVGLLGFSQGAITALSALLERPDAFRWVVALNGAAADRDGGVDALGIPLFVGCKTVDRVIRPARAERAADRLNEALGQDLQANLHAKVRASGTLR